MIRPASLMICLLVCAASLSAQSLGDVARQEAERRKSVVPGKVYTNDSLRPAPTPTTPATAPAPASDAAGASQAPAGPATAAPVAAEAAKKDEVYWRTRIQTENDVLERAKIVLEALQTRVNGLQTDFVNRDDPAARATIAAERQGALGELDRTRTEILQRTKGLAAIREEARRAGVPAAWYR